MAETQNAAYKGEDRRLGALRIHIAYPAAKSDAGVLLYPTIMGLNDSMRSFARAFANEGLTAVVWDPYDGVDGNGVMLDMLARSKQREDQGVVRDLKLIVDHMHEALGVISIGGLGWCFGGRIAILHAGSDRRIKALAVYNPTLWSPSGIAINGVTVSRSDFRGQTLDEFALAAKIRGPVQVSRPERDFPTTAAEYGRLMDALYTRPDPTFYEYYPAAEHGFSYSASEVNQKAHRFAWGTTLSMFAVVTGATRAKA